MARIRFGRLDRLRMWLIAARFSCCWLRRDYPAIAARAKAESGVVF